MTDLHQLEHRTRRVLTDHGHDKPNLAPLQPLTQGCDNTVYATSINGARILVKTRRNASDRYALAAWGARCMEALDIPVPAIVAHGDGICIESRLPGRPLDASPSTTAATTAGRLLRHLHQLPAPGYGRLTEEGTRAKHATLTDWLTDITGDDDLENRILDRIHHHSRRLHCDAPRLLHGDWSPRHVLTEHHQVTGIIDLESLRGGDPIADLAGWTLEAPQPLTEALLCGYAPQGLSPRDQYALTVYRLRAAIALRRWRLAENDHQKTEQIEAHIATDLKTLDRADGSPTASV